MKDAIVTKSFVGCRDGNPIPETLVPGDMISGDLAAVALAEGWADELPDEVQAPTEKPFAKMTLKELEQFAADQNIDLGDASKKGDVLAAIELAQEHAE